MRENQILSLILALMSALCFLGRWQHQRLAVWLKSGSARLHTIRPTWLFAIGLDRVNMVSADYRWCYRMWTIKLLVWRRILNVNIPLFPTRYK